MPPLLRIGLPILLIGLAGCDDSLTEQRQAAENAAAARRLVEADTAIRKDFVTLERNLADERSEIGRQRDLLETERKELASARQRTPLITEGLRSTALLGLCALPLVLCWILLRSAREETGSAELEDLLILEVSGSDSLLAGPPLLTSSDTECDRRRLPDIPPDTSAGPPAS